MASMMQPHSQGKPQLISNINAVADVVRTTLGPRGTDKLIHDDKGNTIISNDGATIMKLLDIVHPAAKILADIASEKVHLHYRIMEVEQYKIIEKIGEGASGVVYKALDTKNNVIVALKEIHVHRVNGIKASNLREVSILKKLKHENVVRLLDVVYTRKRLYAVLEYLDMSLAKHIVSCLEYSDDPYHVKVFLLQLLRGIDYCHSKGVMHRDLKPENLLIDLKSKSLKLADFGLSRVIHCKTLTPKVGTLFYIPPEILLGSDKYSFSSDMWSIGCIFAEMVTRKPLFAGDSEARKVVKGSSEIRQLYRIFQIMGTPKEDTWPGITCLPTFPELVAKDLASVVSDLDDAGVDLLRKMLSLNPSSRITAKVALENAYFKRLTSP